MSTAPLRSPVQSFALLAVALIAALLLFSQAIGQLYSIWNLQPEYSYGILIPLVTAFLIWRDRDYLYGQPLTGSWWGLPLIGLGLVLRTLGQLATMPAVVHYALLLVLYGLVLALTGPKVFRRLLMPLLTLIFMVPLPPIISEQLSLDLQLLSSQIGVGLIRAAGISVFLQGNVIDLGSYQLEVAEACSGLRYLFPLMTLAFLVAYVFRGPLWKRSIIFLASIPITVLMNSFRIGVIGITVDRWGPRMAEGFLHEFEGWVVFMFSSAIVVLIAVVLNKPWRKAAAPAADATVKVGGAATNPAAKPTSNNGRLQVPASLQHVSRSFVAATVVVAVGAVLEFAIPERVEIPPGRVDFASFPNQLGPWEGVRETLAPDILDQLALNDYLMANYRGAGAPPINFYVAYYESQRQGVSVHSPSRCLPAGGWQVERFERYRLPHSDGRGTWPVNRVVIEQGGQRELVYYWFNERGRRLTNEYIVRWYVFWDSLTRNRTDGALVRVIIPVPKGKSATEMDPVLTRFASTVELPLSRSVPD